MARKKKGILLGVGFDNKDGHRRITKSEDFVVTGGSKETHEIIGATAEKFTEDLKKKGKDISELHPDEFKELIEKASR